MSTEAIIAALTRHGDTYEMEDGRTLRLVIEPDTDTHVNDYECYGETSKYAYRYTDREGRAERPAHFDGNAEKIEVDRGLWVWWQPPRGEMAWTEPDGTPARRGSETFDKCRSEVIDLLRAGFYSVGIEVAHDCPTCTHTHQADSAYIGGVDSVANGYLADLLPDLLSEVGID